ncbi:hypothetical protein SAMN05216371_6001 [Streptomyces sp. TLI_053]|nr:hypothetical protein SAMN05216371_6001 [Streptomyces sp. TLI_053]
MRRKPGRIDCPQRAGRSAEREPRAAQEVGPVDFLRHVSHHLDSRQQSAESRGADREAEREVGPVGFPRRAGQSALSGNREQRKKSAPLTSRAPPTITPSHVSRAAKHTVGGERAQEVGPTDFLRPPTTTSAHAGQGGELRPRRRRVGREGSLVDFSRAAGRSAEADGKHRARVGSRHRRLPARPANDRPARRRAGRRQHAPPRERSRKSRQSNSGSGGPKPWGGKQTQHGTEASEFAPARNNQANALTDRFRMIARAAAGRRLSRRVRGVPGGGRRVARSGCGGA